jgi:hypothetical protein
MKQLDCYQAAESNVQRADITEKRYSSVATAS